MQDNTLIRLLPSDYEGGVYRPTNRSRANPLAVSNKLLKELSCDGKNKSYSSTGSNVFMAFFGQFVTEEILNTRRPSCPPNYFNIELPKGHDYNKTGRRTLPFIRTKYSLKSGKSSNNPRKQLNGATAWIDGSVIYGTTRSEAESLRAFKGGLLKSMDEDGLYPALNEGYLSYLSPSRNIQENKMKKWHYRVGNSFAHENPFILTINIIFHRWHNLLAERLQAKHKNWDDEKLFFEARRWVVATLQNVIVNEWLPQFLGKELPEYQRYDPSIDPSISNAFQSAAMRFGHTMVPSAVYTRLHPKYCETSTIRLCDSFYNDQDITKNASVESLILGMAFQASEIEDVSIVDDLRKYLHGPPEFTRRDLAAINLQRGRDHGLPGYGVARKMLLPKEKIEKFDFDQMAALYPRYEKVIKNELPKFYSSMNEVDLFLGGLLEADEGLGPVFKEIILEQFQRIRNGDRFWFQNTENGFFSEDEIQRINDARMFKIILSVTEYLDLDSLPADVFHVPSLETDKDLQCLSDLIEYPCKLFGENATCLALPTIADKSLQCLSSVAPPVCRNSEAETYDYFTGSGLPYALSFLFLFLFIVGCIVALFILVNIRKRTISNLRQSVKQQRRNFSDENSCIGTEWMGKTEGTRDVIINFLADRKLLTICLLNKQMLRSIDLKHVQVVEVHVSTGGHLHYVLVRISREYDIILKFESPNEKEAFIEKLEAFLGRIGIGRQRYECTVNQMLKTAITKADRQKQLEQFFRVVFAQVGVGWSESYRAKAKYQSNMSIAKERSFKSFCTNTASPFGALYRLTRNKIFSADPFMADLISDDHPVTEVSIIYYILDHIFPRFSDSTFSSSPSSLPDELPFTEQKLDSAFSNLKKGKAPGPDGVDNNIIKLIYQADKNFLLCFFNKCLKHSCFPDIFKVGTIVLIRKLDKDPIDANSYRPICLLSSLGKVLE
ncbi:unnamed protein product [Larinioides sclopetarius]|uniref:Peroxidase n=1 Tax=Larinioides sclopetarius TaxID=280406 RepID=A0AAV2BRG2_9ARAC